MTKKRRGFSYAEIVMALALLCILLIPVFPALSLVTRNIETARLRYRAQLFANELVTSAARGLSAEMPVELAEMSYTYGCWITGGGIETAAAPGMAVAMAEAQAPEGDEAFTVGNDGGFTVAIAVVWDHTGNPVGRAMRVLP